MTVGAVEPPVKAVVAIAGAVVPAPAVAVASWDGPRAVDWPLLMAAAAATQKALPAPVRLSNVSGARPGSESVT
jgi:hypothetical protein